ncbi:DUF2695 domain-containing protein [Thiohalobacter thiocyanaticus]|uniref:DUF2695 domain-containing protein n=1 Tax=Thiohalobacter thiocyanaticus TaxID=585455 RepID=A0A426QKD2_9GAMM|nr:DUF2695 domain-containing protein [Thiohalobacter thiocyanaticus]RRQ22223.1 DUF2695 domain-containing protein [Thiohalobacter thiocyanaticus]
MDESDRERKRQWKAQQREVARASFPMSDALMEAFFDSVESSVSDSGCDHTLRFTGQWITANQQPKEPLIHWLEENGGFCDCEVVANARDHWEQNR